MLLCGERRRSEIVRGRKNIEKVVSFYEWHLKLNIAFASFTQCLVSVNWQENFYFLALLQVRLWSYELNWIVKEKQKRTDFIGPKNSTEKNEYKRFSFVLKTIAKLQNFMSSSKKNLKTIELSTKLNPGIFWTAFMAPRRACAHCFIKSWWYNGLLLWR